MNQNDLMTSVTSESEKGREPLKVAVGQFISVADVDTNLDTMDRLANKAASEGSQLIVFPEAAMYQWNTSSETIARIATEEGERYIHRSQDIAIRNNIALIVGGYSKNPDGGRPFNRLTAINNRGEILTSYDKVHLYDAYSWVESDTVTPGPIQGDFSELGVFVINGWRIGLLNCYDLRFPELARGLCERGADVITMSSAWVAGPLKEFHLSTLATARAIENTAYVVVANQPPPLSTGNSSIISPFGTNIAGVDLAEDIATAELREDILESSRAQLPIRLNRRYAASSLPAGTQTLTSAQREG